MSDMTLHHLGYVVRDLFQAARRWYDGEIPQSVTATTSRLSIARYDVRPELGFAAEIHPRTDEFTALFDKVRAASQGWDRKTFLQPFG